MTISLCRFIYPFLLLIWIISELVEVERNAILIVLIGMVLFLISSSIICPILTIYKNRKWKKINAIITDTEVLEEQEDKIYYSKISYTHENQNFEIIHTSTYIRSKNEKITIYLNLDDPTYIILEDEAFLNEINMVIYGLIITSIICVRIYMNSK